MGTDFGSRIRILMRSPDHVLFVGYGLKIVPRKGSGYHDLNTIAQRASTKSLSTPDVRKILIEAFGEGAPEAAIKAVCKRGMGTILVDGGGQQLPLPHAVAAVIYRTRYESVSPTLDDLIPIAGKCRQCGGDLKPYLTNHSLSNSPCGDDHPKTVEDCQRLSNYPVMSIRGYESTKPEEWWPYVSWFHTWDGESYIDDTFCQSRCAEIYGRRAADELPPLAVGGAAPTRKRHSHESFKHYEEETRYVEMSNGKLILI
jgi:hypothetical protein